MNPRSESQVTQQAAPSIVRPPASRLFDLIEGYKATQIVAAAAELGLADELAAGPRSSGELARASGADPGAMLRLLRGRATVGLVEEVAPERFALTDVGMCLRSGERSLRDAAIGLTGPTHWQPWSRLVDAVRSGQPTAEQTLGTDVMSYAAAHPQDSAHFARAMSAISSRVSAEVALCCDASRFDRIVDVGASHGELLAGLLERAPHATGVLLEVPEVIAGACKALAARRLANRVELVAGDFLQELPTDGDLYLLKSILHGRDDQQARRILHNCQRASRPDGTLLVIEGLVPPDQGPSPIHLMDLAMLVALGGRERTRADYAARFDHTGYTLTCRRSSASRRCRPVFGSCRSP